MAYLGYVDAHHLWYRDLINNHYEEARERALSLIEAAAEDENGCLVTRTAAPRKVRYRGQQDRAYRFVWCVMNRYPALSEEVVRHRCNNRRCINPDHLTVGSKWDKWQDHCGFTANGVDFDLLRRPVAKASPTASSPLPRLPSPGHFGEHSGASAVCQRRGPAGCRYRLSGDWLGW